MCCIFYLIFLLLRFLKKLTDTVEPRIISFEGNGVFNFLLEFDDRNIRLVCFCLFVVYLFTYIFVNLFRSNITFIIFMKNIGKIGLPLPKYFAV